MITKNTLRLLLLCVASCVCWSCMARTDNDNSVQTITGEIATPVDSIVVGAARTDLYLPMLQGKRVALLSNHTGMVGDTHTLDLMLARGVNVTTIFSPEHGFRGNADAGEHVSSGVDTKTGIKIASLYDGGRKMPSKQTMAQFDVIVVDIQDVGLRYYTYYITMLRLMNAAVQGCKEVVIFDRPNPNGMYVDGPVLDMSLKSGVGALPIPVVHGMTLGELALMANGEGWLEEGKKLEKLEVIPVKGYTRSMRYELPIAPSPNLKSMKAIYLYPSTCYFEATDVSLGRGTDSPFEIYGHPDMKDCTFEFIPRSIPGAKNPPQLNKLCRGVDLRGLSNDSIIARGVDLRYVIDAYRNLNVGDKFFTSFFEKLIGNSQVRKMIEQGMSAEEIRASWKAEVEAFCRCRAPYLIYPE